MIYESAMNYLSIAEIEILERFNYIDSLKYTFEEDRMLCKTKGCIIKGKRKFISNYKSISRSVEAYNNHYGVKSPMSVISNYIKVLKIIN